MDLTQYIQLGLGGVSIVALYKIVMRFLDVIPKLAKAIEENTKATKELNTYVRTRNGTLERIALADPKTKKAVKEMVKLTKTKEK